MRDEIHQARGEAAGRALPADESRLIDALMSGPPKSRPSIIVVGDDAVSGITPAPMPPEFGSSRGQG